MFTVKKLKISGFKSFAHSTELLIEDGVTGIIGPNGCGKSNIFEAIRWVMGESSSKSLRSGSQDEIIFNGTENVPAKNFAEVSLELSDFNGQIPNLIVNDEKNVVISRLLERGVGSFFKINNKDVRAKDVSIMFYDSGSGSRSSSIISQGNIDQIINFKPIDRKIILEDAAGTSGLHARRHESELKLQSTEVNLEKIDINLNGLYENQKYLSRQARQAERYEEVSKEIKELQSKILFLDWKRVQVNLNDDLSKKEELQREVKLIKTKYNELKQRNETSKKKLSEFQIKKENLSRNLFDLEKEITEQKSKIENINNKRGEILRFLETVQKDKQNEKNNLVEIGDIINKTKKEILSFNSKSDSKEKISELSKIELKTKNEIKRLETLYVNEIQLSLGEEFKSDTLKENKEVIEKNIDEIVSEINNYKDRNNTYRNNLSKLNLDLKKLKIIYKDSQEKLKKQKDEIYKIEKKKLDLNKDVKAIILKIENCSLQNREIQTEIKTLNQIVGEDSLSEKSIINLLKIKQGYENAVYAALTNELDATLYGSKKRWVKSNINDLSEVDNSLSNYVDGPDELTPILSQIGFINNDKVALEMQKKLSVGQMIVNKQGQIWRWDGFISEDNLQKKKIIDSYLRVTELQSKNKKLQIELSNFEKIKKSKVEEEDNNIRLLSKGNTIVKNLYDKLDSLSPQISKLNEQISIMNFNVQDTTNKIKKLELNLSDSNKKLKEIRNLEESSQKNNKAETDNVQNKISDLDNNLEKVRNEINLLKQKVIREELNKTHFQNDLLKSQKRFEETSKKIFTLEKREKFYVEEKNKLTDLPINLVDKINNLQGEINEIAKNIKSNQDSQNSISLNILSEEKELNKIDRQRETKQSEILIIDTNLVNNNSKEREIREIIYKKTSLQPEDIENSTPNESIGIENHSDIKIRLETLLTQRERMGPVNLRAKLEEKELTETINELELEKNDLVQAIDKLRVAIAKINSEGRKRLIEAFQKVDKNFSDLFKKLFNGGDAKLELIKSDDPLQTGIEIYAKPPGKKLSSLSLLSGGEKTLTAISLIFSIFLINPSPICILDEVDAALDEINVQKFCKLLDQLKSGTKTKFLLITHNKITMSSLDRVYGVTMTQKGISDVVSVDFTKIDLKKAV